MGCKALQLEDYFQLIDSNADNSRKSFTYNELGKTLENPAGNEYNLFTGKPQIGGLGYAFLFRNYRSNLGKWQTNDPIGYPDGWNNLAYVNNKVTNSIDWLGASTISNVYDLWRWWFFGKFMLNFNDSYENPKHTSPGFSTYGVSTCTLGMVISFGGQSFGLGTKMTLSNLTKNFVSSSISSGTLNGKPTKFLSTKYMIEWKVTATSTAGGSSATATEIFRRNITLKSMVQE